MGESLITDSIRRTENQGLLYSSEKITAKNPGLGSVASQSLVTQVLAQYLIQQS